MHLRQFLGVPMPQLEKSMATITQTPSIAALMLIMRPVIWVKLRLIINSNLLIIMLSVAMIRLIKAPSLTIITMVTLKTMAQLVIAKTQLCKERILRSVAKTLISSHLLSKVIWLGNIKRLIQHQAVLEIKVISTSRRRSSTSSVINKMSFKAELRSKKHGMKTYKLNHRHRALVYKKRRPT